MKRQQQISAFIFNSLVLAMSCIGCPIKYITGISCAGCGMTRACFSALRLDFSRAFYYHPLFWMVPVIGAIVLNQKKIPDKLYKAGMALLVLSFLVVYIIRLLDVENEIVTIDFSESLLGHMVYLGMEIIS